MTKPSTKERSCRICGCTEKNACITAAGPCSWVAADICSNPRCILKRWTSAQRNWINKAAFGRVTVRRCCAPFEENFAPRFLPRVAAVNVVMPGMPEFGYLTEGDAVLAGERYSLQCAGEVERLAAAKQAMKARR